MNGRKLEAKEKEEAEKILLRLFKWNKKYNNGKYLDVAIVGDHVMINNDTATEQYFSVSAFNVTDKKLEITQY